MTTAETITQLKDIVLILFLVFASGILTFWTVLSLRLHKRAVHFMDRMEHVAEGFEETFGRVVVARKAVEDAAAVLRPVASGLGLLGMFQGVGKMFGGGSKKPSSDEDDS